MTVPLSEPNEYKEIWFNAFQTKDVRQKPLAFGWWQPDCTGAAVPGDETYSTDGCKPLQEAVVLQNGFVQPTTASGIEKFAFRLHADSSLEFKGHLDASGASSGTVAFTLPGMNLGEVNFVPLNDHYFITAITPDGSTFSTALVFIDSTTGDVTLTWPAA